MTYSDDEFGSDYEAEYSVDASDGESEQQQAPGDTDNNLTRVLAAAQDEQFAAGADTEEIARPITDASTTTLVPSPVAAAPKAEQIQHLPSNEPAETSAGAVSTSTEDNPKETSASQQPKLLGQLSKLVSIRSLSVPVVPAASLVDPSLLVPSNLRSTSVPVVPSNEIIGIHRQNSGRFRIETASRTNARHKSIVRLPSVEEMIGQGDVIEESDEDPEEDSESDDAADSPPSSLGNSPRGRSSSFQKILPPKISPVLRTKSQPFMTRLPSVIEVTAEEMEMLYLENVHGESKTKSDKEDIEASNFSDDETNVGPASGQPTDLPAPKPEAVAAAEMGTMATTGPVDAELQIERPSPAIDAERKVNEQPQTAEEPDDDYEDDYDDQRLPDPSEQVTNERRASEEQQELLDDDEFQAADETTLYNEYEGKGDDYGDVHFEDESRRETEMLLREAQLLIQKQHETTSDRMELLASITSESPDQSEPSETVEAARVVLAVGVEAVVVEEELVSPTTEPESTAVVPTTNVEDLYGGDDEFTTVDDDDGGEDEFDQYASDQNEAQDDVGEDSRESKNRTFEQKSPGIVLPAEQIPTPEAELRDSSASQLASSAGTDTQSDVSQPQATHNELTTEEPEPAATETLLQAIAPSNHHRESDHAEQSEPTANEISATTQNSQETKEKPSAALGSSTPAATQKPTRVVTTRPSRPPAATMSGPTNHLRASRPVQPAAPERRKVVIAESVLKRERPRELRLKTQRSGTQSSSTPALSNTLLPPRTAQPKPEEFVIQETDTKLMTSASQPTHEANASVVVSPTVSPKRDAPKSPEKIAPYIPRVYVEEYEPPPPKAPVFRQKRATKPRVEDAVRRKLLPMKSPPNLRIDLLSMDKTKRNWLFLNMFRHGDDVSKYESFVPQLMSPGLPQSAGRPSRPDSGAQQTYANSQAQAIAAYGGGRGSRCGRRLVQPPQQDPALREREHNWAPTKPHESAIPAYDSILDKFCTTVTSPVIQRQIYQTRHDDLSPQLAYVLEKRVERQWKAGGAAEAFGAASSSYNTDVVHSPSSHSTMDKRSP